MIADEPMVGDTRDAGITIVELLASIVVLGIIMSTLFLAFMTSLRVAPDTETRIDDARATRGLATWLTSDTISAPPFLGENAQGGIVLDQGADSNDCGMTGSNLVHLQWTEVTDQPRTFVANYRLLDDPAGTKSIVRYVCYEVGVAPLATPFPMITQRTVTSGLSATSSHSVTPVIDGVTGFVTSIQFELVGASGETVLVETGSRNPADFFP